MKNTVFLFLSPLPYYMHISKAWDENKLDIANLIPYEIISEQDDNSNKKHFIFVACYISHSRAPAPIHNLMD